MNGIGRQARQAAEQVQEKGGVTFYRWSLLLLLAFFLPNLLHRYIDSGRNKFLIARRFPFPFLSFLPAQEEEDEDTTSTALEK